MQGFGKWSLKTVTFFLVGSSRIWEIEDIQIVETVPCSLFPIPSPHRQLFQQPLFSICIVTIDGQIYKVGDFEQLFTIQSISQVFVYGQALEDHGRDYVLTRVGVEPTGEAFNAIILDKQSKCLYNPIVNAGTIATTSLIKGNGTTDS